MSASPLCLACQTLLIRPDISMRDEIQAQYDHQDVLGSSKTGCPICYWIWDWVASHASFNELGIKPTITATLRVAEYDDDVEIMLASPNVADILRIIVELHSNTNTQAPASLELLLRSIVNGPRGVEVKLKRSNDLYGRSTVLACTKNSAISTRNPSCLRQVRKWLDICRSQHELCCKMLFDEGESFQLPTRLIDIKEPKCPRLVQLSAGPNTGSIINYTTLSHRWAAESMPKLTKGNINLWLDRMDFRGFPPAFRDALEVTRYLDIQYVWIDALCIIQDSPEDWRKESAMMGRIYHNAACNIGAYAAAERPVGLFVERDPRRASLSPVFIQRKEFQHLYGVYVSSKTGSLTESTLMRRGWVLQERLLSPRSIYFDDQLHWECSELQACESFPQSGPALGTLLPWGADGTPFRAAGLIYGDWTYRQRIQGGYGSLAATPVLAGVQELYRKWLFLVEFYTQCRLTFEKDRFPALSGLARCFQHVVKDKYVAGLWMKDFLHGLVWYSRPHSTDHKLKTYQGPSWSWASASGPVTFPIMPDCSWSDVEHVWTAKVIETAVLLTSTDPYGRVSGGRLRISGPIRRINPPFQSLWLQKWPMYSHAFDEDIPPFEYPPELYYFLLCYRVEIHYNGMREIQDLKGLILAPTGRGPNEYLRIGFFQHEWFQQRLVTGEWPCFIDFDPKRFDTEEIVIV